MPVYEYRCTRCEHQFDIWQEVGSAPPPCEKCGSEVKKIFHPVRTIFKGSGFYITDTRAESAKSSGSSSGSSSSDSSSTPAASESKADGKSEGRNETSGSEKASTPAVKSETKAAG